jgi:hypothetical protein
MGSIRRMCRDPFLPAPLSKLNLAHRNPLRLGSRPRHEHRRLGEVALLVRTWFVDRGLHSLPKVSGSKGLQVYVPLNTPSSYEITQPIARRVAEDLERSRPKRIISRMARADRAGKVFIDWSQNAAHKTTVSVYSLRAKSEQPLVSMPISWEEVESALSDSTPEGLVFTPEEAVSRVNRVGDLFAPALNEKQTLPKELLRELGLAETEPPRQSRGPSQSQPRSSNSLPTLCRAAPARAAANCSLFIADGKGSS